jgi:hypothetical protein
MSRQYSPRQFLRQTANVLLEQYFHDRNLLQEIRPFPGNETHVQRIYEAFQALLQPQREAVERDFRTVDELACEGGIKTLVEEASFQGVGLASELDRFEGLHSKAMWAFLFRQPVFNVARLFTVADGMGRRHWACHKDMPTKEPDTSEEAQRSLGRALSDYYLRTQGRGRHCTVEYYLRRNRSFYFFAFPDDYAETFIGHDQAGEFVRRAQRRAFQVVFVYDPGRRTLDLFAQGTRQLREELRRVFCRVILGDETAGGRSTAPTYNLDGLLERRAAFPTDPSDGIEEVRILSLRLALSETGCRITLEPDLKSPPEGIYDCMDEHLRDGWRTRYVVHVTRATFRFRFVHLEGKRARLMTFDVTHPDSCTLKSLSEEDRVLGEKYLRRWGIERD